jgi:hypothetical protein
MNTHTTHGNTNTSNKQTKAQKKEKYNEQKKDVNKDVNKDINKDINSEINNEINNESSKEQQNEHNAEHFHVNKLKDIHKFLFDLWNKREIDIVINLYKELESKKNTDEQNSLYDNIMNYCSMKETKLNKYIEQISSVL